MIDADCRLEAHAIHRLATTCQALCCPVQALYRMKTDDGDPNTQRIAHFAWLVINHVRPLGLAKLGLPCQLMGTGMSFPWRLIRSANLASGNLVEDVKLGLDLAASGAAPRLCVDTYVQSGFGTSENARLTQRQRWEAGSLRILTRDGPVFFAKAVVTRNLPLLVLALDALVPPLVILAAILVAFLLTATILVVGNIAIAPFFIILAALVIFALSLILAWTVYGRAVLPISAFGAITTYLLQKLRIHRPGSRRGLRWTRTDRH